MDVARSPLLDSGREAHVFATNYGWSLFGCLPLICGNRHASSWSPFVLFRNDIRPEYVYERASERARADGCLLDDLVYSQDDGVLFNAWYCEIPWIIVYRECNLSATLRREGSR